MQTQPKPKTRKFPFPLPPLNFTTIGIGLLVLLCLVVIVYDLGRGDEPEVLVTQAPINDNIPPGEQLPPTPEPPPPAEAQVASTEDTFYSEYRLQRELVRSEELELLQSIIDDPATSTEMRDLANNRKLTIAESMSFELMTENVLYAKDFGQTIVMMGRETATVILTGELDDILAARIADAVNNVTGISFENVIIINR